MASCLLPSALPQPPLGAAGWPWTADAPSAFATQQTQRTWPRFTVVTPSLNQGAYLEKAIRSVLLQYYPNLEYIVIDGGSTDDSVDILRKYEGHLSYWTSEFDRGQSHAINKGFARATGQILCWLNSDDFFLPNALRTAAEELLDGSGAAALVGHTLRLDAGTGRLTKGEGRFDDRMRLLQFWKGYHMHQPSIFWRREVFEAVGFLDESQQYIMDFDYWARIAERFTFKNVDHVFSCQHYHPAAKTGDGYRGWYDDLRRQATRYFGTPFRPEYWYLRAAMANHYWVRPRLRLWRSLAARVARHLRMLR